MSGAPRSLLKYQADLRACRACPGVQPPVVVGEPAHSTVYLLGQAPGAHEGPRGKPFAHTAGKTLFGWFQRLGVDEATFRQRVYMAAVLRCFPGKAPKGGDRVPSAEEITRCARWIAQELELLSPRLVIAVGKLALGQVLGPVTRLEEVVGPVHRARFHGHEVDCVALPHPSGVSVWPKREPGKTLLASALQVLGEHPAWRATFAEP